MENQENKEVVQKEKVTGLFKPDNKEVSFNRVWGGHRFTDDEVDNLLEGNTIQLKDCISLKTGKPFSCMGKLSQQTYEDHKFYGFELKEILTQVPKSWCGHTFNDYEKSILNNGGKIHLENVTSKAGKIFSCDVEFKIDENSSNIFKSIVPSFPKEG